MSEEKAFAFEMMEERTSEDMAQNFESSENDIYTCLCRDEAENGSDTLSDGALDDTVTEGFMTALHAAFKIGNAATPRIELEKNTVKTATINACLALRIQYSCVSRVP